MFFPFYIEYSTVFISQVLKVIPREMNSDEHMLERSIFWKGKVWCSWLHVRTDEINVLPWITRMVSFWQKSKTDWTEKNQQSLTWKAGWKG